MAIQLSPDAHKLLGALVRKYLRANGLGRQMSEQRATAAVLELLDRGFVTVEYDPKSGTYSVRAQ